MKRWLELIRFALWLLVILLRYRRALGKGDVDSLAKVIGDILKYYDGRLSHEV